MVLASSWHFSGPSASAQTEPETYKEGDIVPVILSLNNPIATEFTLEWEVRPGPEAEGTPTDESDYSLSSGSFRRTISPKDGVKIRLGALHLTVDNIEEGPEIFDIYLTGVFDTVPGVDPKKIEIGAPRRIRVVDNEEGSTRLPIKDLDNDDGSTRLPIRDLDNDDGSTPPNLPSPPSPETKPNWSQQVEVEPKQRSVVFCGLGWHPGVQSIPQFALPKVMMYALEFTFDQQTYTCSAIEIRTGDAGPSDLHGWKLELGRLYNPSEMTLTLTDEKTQIIDNVLRLTPDVFGQQTFPCATGQLPGYSVPSLHYVLKNEAGVVVDRAYSCYILGQIAYTHVNGRWVESRRRISPRLQSMDIPRIERYITKENSIYITYIPFEDFQWDRIVLSDWLLPASQGGILKSPNAPSRIRPKLTTTWGSLKSD